MGTPEAKTGRFEQYLPAGKFKRLPTPFRWLIALLLWPFVAVAALIAGAGYLLVGLMLAAIAVVLVVTVTIGGVGALTGWPAAQVLRGILLGGALVLLAIWDEREAERPSRENKRRATAIKVVRRTAFVALVGVFAVGLSRATQQRQANEPYAVVVVAVVAYLIASAYIRADDRYEPAAKGWWRAGLTVLAIGAAFGLYVGYQDRKDGKLREYCSYGVTSQAELEGCLNHVTDAQIDSRDTEAAHFARGQTNVCGAEAGPYCRPRPEEASEPE